MQTERPLRILLVEDNPDTQLLLEYVLQPDYDVDLAARVDEALEAAQTGRYDVLLIDINLGEERTGVDLLRALRETSACRDTPALALTAYAMPGDRERFLEAGFDAYVSKPFTRDELDRAIRAVLGERS